MSGPTKTVQFFVFTYFGIDFQFLGVYISQFSIFPRFVNNSLLISKHSSAQLVAPEKNLFPTMRARNSFPKAKPPQLEIILPNVTFASFRANLNLRAFRVDFRLWSSFSVFSNAHICINLQGSTQKLRLCVEIKGTPFRSHFERVLFR